MALAILDTVRKRIIQLLNANPEAFAATVSSESGAFPFDAEITEAIFEAEAMIVREGYFNSVNPTLGRAFAATSANFASGDLVPEIRGNNFVVELSQNGTTFEKGIEAAHVDDVVNLDRFNAYIEPFAGKYLFKFDGGRFYSSALFGRIKTLAYTRGAALQVGESEEFLVIATTIRLLTKNSSNAPFEIYRAESERGIEQLKTDGIYRAQQEANN